MLGEMNKKIAQLQESNKQMVSQTESKLEAKIEESGDESPGLTVLGEDFLRHENAKRIREDSMRNYNKNMKQMKTKHDRLRKVNVFNVGDVGGLIIPEDYIMEHANKLPVVIASVHNFGETQMYTLAYGQDLLENKYYQHELLKSYGSNDYYGVIVQQSPYDYMAVVTGKAQSKEVKPIPVQTAYKQYVDLISNIKEKETDSVASNKSTEDDDTWDDENMHDDTDCNKDKPSKVRKSSSVMAASNESNSILIIPNQMNAIIVNKETCERKLVKVSITNSICAVCCGKIATDAQALECHNCGRSMHAQKVCKFGMVQYPYGGYHYCSLACHLKQTVYEVKIIAEVRATKKNNQRKYVMLYKNGETTQLAAHKVEKLAQYAKMVHDWREQHPFVGDDVDMEYEEDDEVKITACTIAVSKPTNMKDNICCVCSMELTAMNQHTCYRCKRRMHGVIICSMKHLMYADDDKLYYYECKVHVM